MTLGSLTKKNAVAVAGSAILSGWAIALLLDAAGTSRDSWVAAIQLVSATALIVVTALYVDLTRQLVNAQHHAPLSAARVEALVRTIEELVTTRRAAHDIAGQFPLGAGAAEPNIKEIEALYETVTSGSDNLFLAVYALPPPWGPQAGRHANDMIKTYTSLAMFLRALTAEKSASTRDGRPWDWHHVERHYREFQARATDEPPWDTFLVGENFAVMDETLTRFLADLGALRTVGSIT